VRDLLDLEDISVRIRLGVVLTVVHGTSLSEDYNSVECKRGTLKTNSCPYERDAMARTPRFQIPPKKATKLRELIRSRLHETSVPLHAAVPDRWREASDEAGLRKIKRVLQADAPLAYEDGFELVQFLSLTTINNSFDEPRNVLKFWPEKLHAFDEEFRRLPAREQRKIIDATRRIQRAEAPILKKTVAAITLVQPPQRTPSLAIFPGETRHLVAYLSGAIESELGLSPEKAASVSEVLRKHLLRFEKQMTETEPGRILLAQLSSEWGPDKNSYRYMFLGLTKTDPSGRSKQKAFANPWRAE